MEEEDALREEPANKAELVALGLAIRDLALKVESLERTRWGFLAGSYGALGLSALLLLVTLGMVSFG